MKSYSFFIGCNIPVRVPAYAASTRRVLNHLGLPLVDVEAFGCCGYPVRNAHQDGWLVAAAGNMALAEQEGLELLVLCKCCFGSLKAAQYLLAHDRDARQRITRHLHTIGLDYQGNLVIRHLLSVLYQDIGVDELAARVSSPFEQLDAAVHYGCHALRPSRITEFDDPVAPKLFDELVGVTGAMPIAWPSRLECCGAPLLGTNDLLAQKLKERKIADARAGGARFICTACPWCQIQFNCPPPAEDHSGGTVLPGILYTQLLGLSLGLDPDALLLEKLEKEILNGK